MVAAKAHLVLWQIEVTLLIETNVTLCLNTFGLI